MRPILAKCTVLALLAAGFAFTGDAGRFLARGRGVLEATTVPRSPLADDAPVPPPVPAQPQAPAPAPPRGDAPVAPPRPPADAPVGQGRAARIPADGPDSVTIGALSAGDRIVVWIRRGAERGGVEALTFDLVDPAGGDAIETRGGTDEPQLAPNAPRRRVRIAGSVPEGLFRTDALGAADGTIRRRRSLAVTPIENRTGGQGPAAPESIGPVVALEVVRRP